MQSAEELIRSLGDYYQYIKKKARTGGDLYTSFEGYHDFVLDNWPKDMPDNGNWISEMKSVLSHIWKKRNVVGLSRSRELRSLRDDAVEAIHSINMKFMMHLKQS